MLTGHLSGAIKDPISEMLSTVTSQILLEQQEQLQ